MLVCTLIQVFSEAVPPEVSGIGTRYASRHVFKAPTLFSLASESYGQSLYSLMGGGS
jgi:hypothetical protein